jgi:hypothetical protein
MSGQGRVKYAVIVRVHVLLKVPEKPEWFCCQAEGKNRFQAKSKKFNCLIFFI